MRFEEATFDAEFIKRYKRFFADIRVGNDVITALVPNTGTLKTCLFEGSACVISESNNPKRKLKATLQFLKTPGGWVGVNTSLPNDLVHEAWREGLVPEWREFAGCKMEFKISKETRLDMVLGPTQAHIEEKRSLTYVEVKNVTMACDGVARFPDCVTTRGQKHLRELMRLKAEGAGAELVFVVQREGCTSFSPADDLDPEYGRLLRAAVAAGVVVRAFTCDIEPLAGIKLNPKKLPILL